MYKLELTEGELAALKAVLEIAADEGAHYQKWTITDYTYENLSSLVDKVDNL